MHFEMDQMGWMLKLTSLWFWSETQVGGLRKGRGAASAKMPVNNGNVSCMCFLSIAGAGGPGGIGKQRGTLAGVHGRRRRPGSLRVNSSLHIRMRREGIRHATKYFQSV